MSTPAPPHDYVTDTLYADRVFRELSPAWLNYVAAINGGAPRPLDAPFTYLEMGCGLGSSAVVNAGSFPQGEFHACDLNAGHIESGTRLAADLGVGNVRFHHATFEHLLTLDLPAFDFIALHGVYTWVGAEAREAIRRVIAARLKPGGLVYVSYNCLPGWAAEAPLRALMVELARTETGDTAHRARSAVRTMERLRDARLRFFRSNPAAASALEAYARQPGEYLAHEFLNETWDLFSSPDVADQMAAIGLGFLGSATLADNHPALVLESQAAEAITALATERARQLAIDLAVNQRFRRDVFVRGGARFDPGTVARHVGALVIGSLEPERIASRVLVPRGEIRFQDALVGDLRSLMAAGSMTMDDLVDTLAGRGADAGEIARNVTFLVAADALMPFARVHSAGGMPPRRTASPMLARALPLAIDGVLRAIPSEVAGTGVPIQPAEALAVKEWLSGADGHTMTADVIRLVPAFARLGWLA